MRQTVYEINRLAVPDSRIASRGPGQVSSGYVDIANGDADISYGAVVRKYLPLGLLLAVVGGAIGAATAVLSTPMYRVRTMIEVQGINESLLKNSFELPSSYDTNQVNILTQIKLMLQGPFLGRVYDRLQAEAVPLPPPVQTDIFSRVRRRVRPAIDNPVSVMHEALGSAFNTFDARPVNGTRLIEISCDSNNPQIAAQFVNTMASEFIDETMRTRAIAGQRTNEWLNSQIEEGRIRLQDAEKRLQDFVRQSGNVFAAQDSTLDDTKLKQLQAELADIQADRIAKQTRHEMAMQSQPDTLGEVLDAPVLRGYESQIADLRRQKAALETTLMPGHSKVIKISAQITAVETALRNEAAAVLARIRGEYESALSRERLLAAAYAAQSQRVTTVAGKSAEYNALRREVEGLRQIHQGLLVQANQTGLSNSVPVTPIRLVAAAASPSQPYSPKPVLNISFGTVAGLFLTGGLAFLWRARDKTVRTPATSRVLLDLPQLGVIPSAPNPGLSGRLRMLRPLGVNAKSAASGAIAQELPEAAMVRKDGSFMAESFRSTLTSLLRKSAEGNPPRVIIIASPGPGEGKTMVACNVAMALAETGRKVLLVDADCRRPRLHRIFGLSKNTGFADLLKDQTGLTERLVKAAIPAQFPGLHILANQVVGDELTKLLRSPRLKILIEAMRNCFDVVVLDTPPLLDLADTRIIAPHADGVILVLRAGATDRQSALGACECLQSDGVAVLGTVLNDWNPGRSWAKKRYYYKAAE
jgi:capsular exopolysaccharide synthesis family protein